MTNTTYKNRKPLLIGAAVCAVAAVAVGVWLAKNPTKEPLYGMMQAKTVDVAAKVTGRVQTLKVREGDNVAAGDLLMLLDIPEVEAKLKEVRALQEAAAAKSSLVDEGARPQEIRAAKAQMQRAQAGAQLAGKTYNRVRSLYKDGLVSKQKYDEALAQKQSADQMLTMAREQYDIAVTGARTQEKTAASALSQQAAGGVEQVQTIVDEKNVTAPLAAEVSRIFVEEGEIAAAGVALVSLVDLSDQWVVFNVREDAMVEIKKGTKLTAEIPALGRKDVTFEVYFINARGEYATWRATRQSTGFDLKTFEVRARPVTTVADLRPGMSVIVHR
ncbi:MAG: efflux RND transporter periplasmic adaptor subunit [Candidatus Aphodousia sp.]|nr:efflux RND transporter periplasmic adaptor subunit [Sutterella sp.]MDY2899661.1 efflux RND transporter periplasmic adaptor subunit [Candidatus Aphodousia sp.]